MSAWRSMARPTSPVEHPGEHRAGGPAAEPYGHEVAGGRRLEVRLVVGAAKHVVVEGPPGQPGLGQLAVEGQSGRERVGRILALTQLLLRGRNKTKPGYIFLRRRGRTKRLSEMLMPSLCLIGYNQQRWTK
eukprot:scaffold680867_cov37-Prasinocladus_malaysianus.AAC.1